MAERKFLTADEVSERYRGEISVGTLRNWRAMRVGPAFVKIGKAVLYPVDELDAWDEKNLVACRASRRLTVTDEVLFSKPCHFGTALITFDRWERPDVNTLLVYDEDEKLRIDITVTADRESHGDFEIEGVSIKENLKTGTFPTRLGINLQRPVRRAKISLRITPPSIADRNGDE